MKIRLKRLTKYFLTELMLDFWNCLPAYVVKRAFVDSFKKLDKFWSSQDYGI